MEEQKGVTAGSPSANGSEPDTNAPVVESGVETPQPQKPPKGFVPFQALEEERTKRKEAEEKLVNLSTPTEDSDEIYSDEGKFLRKEINALNDKIRVNERKEARREVESEFPILKERRDDFEGFLEDEENKRLSIRKAAKLFLAESNLLAPEPPVREGLEKPSGGGQSAPEPKFSTEEIQHLMKNDWKQYEKLLRAGKI